MSMLEDHLWDLANGITAFAAAQGITLSYALVTKNSRNYFRKSHWAMMAVLLGKLLVAGAYSFAIWKCYAWTLKLPELDILPDIWYDTTIGRIIAVVYFCFLPLLALGLSNLLQAEKRDQTANK